MADIAVLGFDIDSTPARTAATDLMKLGQAAVEVSRASISTERAIRNLNGTYRSSAAVIRDLGGEVSDLAAGLNTTAAQALRMQKREIDLNRAVELGLASVTEKNILLDQYAASLRESNPLIQQMERAEREAAQASAALEASKESLRQEFLPLYAASKQYEMALERLNTAEREGVLTTDQYNAALDRLNTSYARSANGLNVLDRSMQTSTHHVANLSFQINDIGMMLASGQSPFMLMIQQGPQVAQVFSQMAAQGQRIGPTLASAFRMVLNPTTLLTLGLIGGAAALVQWARGSGEAEKGAEDFLTTLKELESTVSRIGSAPNLLTPEGVAKVRSEYGFLTMEVRSLVAALGEVEMQQARMAAQATITEILGNFDASFFTSRMQAVINLTGLAADEAQRFEIQLNQLSVAQGPENQLRIVTQLRQQLQESGKNSGALFDSLVKTESELRKLVKQSQDLAKGMRESDRYAKLFSQTVAATSMSHLVAQASAMGARLREAASVRLPGAGSFGSSILEGAANAWNMALDRVEDVRNKGLGDRPLRRPFELGVPDPEDTGSGGGGGGGGGGASAADQIQEDFKNRWKALQEGFKGEFDLSLVEYQKQLETLDWALSQKLIKEQEFQRNKQLLYTMTFGTEAQQNLLQYQLDQEALQLALDQKLITHQTYLERLKAMQFEYQSQAHMTDQNMLATNLGRTSQYFGQLVSLTGNSYDTLAKLQQSFAAGQALVNAYLAASQTLADPTLGFWGKMAAYGKVLAAGLGLVSAIKGAGGGSSGGSGGGAGGQAATAAQQQPTREVLVRLEGDEWLVGLASGIMEQIYDQTKDGRVVVARDF